MYTVVYNFRAREIIYKTNQILTIRTLPLSYSIISDIRKKVFFL